MKTWITFASILCGALVAGQQLQAGEVSLYDWCFNINNSVDATSWTNNPSNACNGGTNAPLTSLDTSAWDSTLVTNGSNNLGTAVITLTPGISNVAFYADYDLDYTAYGSFADFGTVVGTLPSGWSYELDDPNVSDIFTDFAANVLTNLNNVSTPGVPPNECCDVSWALSINGISVPDGGTGTVRFTVSTAVPTNGFYLEQTNQYTQDSIYLSATVNVENPFLLGAPEPSTTVLALAAFGAALTPIALRHRLA